MIRWIGDTMLNISMVTVEIDADENPMMSLQ
jgi:hypothetical protein